MTVLREQRRPSARHSALPLAAVSGRPASSAVARRAVAVLIASALVFVAGGSVPGASANGSNASGIAGDPSRRAVVASPVAAAATAGAVANLPVAGIDAGQLQYARPLRQPITITAQGLLKNLARPLPSVRTSSGTSAVVELPVASAAIAAAAASDDGPLLANGSFDEGTASWFRSHLADQVTATVVNTETDRTLEVTAAVTEGSVANDLALVAEPGRSYGASIRAVSPSGFPVLVELAIHGLKADGTLGETATRFVMVEGHEVPITATLVPTESHASLRVELYVHTIDRSVRLDDATVVIDGSNSGPSNYGYQQPRVRYLGDADIGALTPGETYEVEVSVGTTTDQPWLCCGSVGAIYLGTEDEDLIGGSARASELHVPAGHDGSNWTSKNRIAFDRDESTIGGSFTTVITAPTRPGPFAERFRLVSEGVTWIPGPVIEIIGFVSEPIAEDVADGDDSTSDLILDCPPLLSIAKPDPSTSDCVAEILGFAPQASDVGAGRFTLSWNQPDAVSVDFYVIEIQDLGLPAGAIRESAAVTLETGERSLLIETKPGRYSLRVIALDENGQWVRSPDLEVTVTEPPPIVEVDLPPIGCPAVPVTGSGFPIPCTPIPGGDPTGPRPLPGVPDCENVPVEFEDDVLMRYRGSDLSSMTEIDLSCSRYDIELLSSDPRHGDDYQPNQTGERWYLQGLNADGDVIYTSPVTPDLPAGETESTLLVGPVDLEGVVAFRAKHFGRGESANSITVAAHLIPVG